MNEEPANSEAQPHPKWSIPKLEEFDVEEITEGKSTAPVENSTASGPS